MFESSYSKVKMRILSFAIDLLTLTIEIDFLSLKYV